MNINQIKLLTWLVSAGVTVGVGYYVYEFQTRAKVWRQEQRIPPTRAKEILEDVQIPEGPVATLVDMRSIERAYYFNPNDSGLPNLLDWSGQPPKEAPKVIDKPVEKPKEPTFKPIGPLIQLVAVFEDIRSPDRGIANIQYKPESQVKARPDGLPVEIRVGEKLAEPLDYATVKAIRAEEIVFSFDDEAREDEVVGNNEYDPMIDIYVVDQDNPVVERSKDDVPRVNLDTWRPERTTAIDKGFFVLGTEDVRDFGDDFAGIIAREVRHSRHFNRKTGKYDGIELKEVKSGGRIASHGGQSGDIIKSINGHPVTSSSEAVTYVKNNKDKFDKWIVVVENKGKERTMTFESPPGDGSN